MKLEEMLGDSSAGFEYCRETSWLCSVVRFGRIKSFRLVKEYIVKVLGGKETQIVWR